jgi:Domain of unknown function (DUF1883)
MNFLHYKVVTRPRDRIRVYLKGNAANVLVMDDLNFANYRQGLQYDYYGGYYAVSPVIITPGLYGNLNVVVSLGGLPGSVNAVVQVLHRGR